MYWGCGTKVRAAWKFIMLKAQLKDNTLDMAIKPLAPFCITGYHTAEDNLFRSVEYIPGNVILDTLWRTLDRIPADNGEVDGFEQLKKHFGSIRLLHAFPAKGSLVRPVTPPLSLAKVDDTLYDIALLDDPHLVEGLESGLGAGWKDSSDVRKMFGWPVLGREFRVCASIDNGSRRGQEESPFSCEMVVPDGHCWLTRAYFHQVQEGVRKDVMRQFQGLLKVGLLGFGKTKTLADVQALPAGTISVPKEASEIPTCFCTNKEIVITLQTPALLLNPKAQDTVFDEGADYRTLFSAYTKIWTELSSGELELKRFFARQIPYEGRYQDVKHVASRHHPWILTEAGSVFVFQVRDRCWSKKIDLWLQDGIPLSSNVIRFYGISPTKVREQCPFIPQNGFGEIAVNLEIHWEALPRHGPAK